MQANFSSSNRITVTENCTKSHVDPATAKLSPFQDVEDMEFDNVCDDDYPQLDIVSLRAISDLRSGLDFSEESNSNDIIRTVINLITSQAGTPAEQSLGKFTRRKLKNMDTWNDWEAGERKQLNQFHDLQMFGDHRLWLVLLKKILSSFDRIGNTMLSVMDNAKQGNVVMAQNVLLQYCMH